jgi:Helix-turn-helix of DDE superfamily endonuclease
MEIEGEALRLSKRPVAFRRLVGLNVLQFMELLEKFAPLMAAADAKRLNKRERQRKIGAGNEYSLPLCDRLLMTLIYYRTYVSQEFLGYLFDLDDANVCRNMARARPVLAQIFRVPEKRIKVDPKDVATLFLMARNNGSTDLKAA